VFSLAIVFAASAGAAAAERLSSVPASFQGEWVADPKGCTSKPDDSRLTIGTDRIRFHESSGAIKAVVMQGELDLALIAEMSGEGETWLDYRHFRLSADRASLTDVTQEPGFVRHRCAKVRGK
jgi:hypothetical protein